ncbi:MAG: Peptide methionine sulfoxide reductase MsrA [Candidatus Taylorbacteria bacterium]|nr:Peptide methionine sulfoxide reductase MsrA [Candidatus Taylorbacteria bacterium]
MNKEIKNNEVAIFGGGCFWCTEAVFKMLKGVSAVMPGYAGGKFANPTYEQVCDGNTGHAEVIHIEYDPSVVGYDKLLMVFFGSHDPTTRNRQGNDVGTQYRSVIFYTTPEQKAIAEKFIADINASNKDGKPIVTEVVPLETGADAPGGFYPAESYHHDYFARNKGNPYCEVIINPKLEKVQKMFADLISDNQ